MRKAQGNCRWAVALFALKLTVLAAIAAPAQNFTTLVNFRLVNGADPVYVSLVQGLDGGLYGTTSGGGASGFGTVFKVTPSGALTSLYSFCAQAGCADGAYPEAGLALGTDGNLYGTTNNGGGGASCPVGCGTIFKITPSGTLTTLHEFDGTDGYIPRALIQAIDGNFYGTTTFGGTGTACGQDGCGTVFKITPSGTLTTLHNFDASDGTNPDSPLLQATDRNFYATTSSGGANNWGTVFKITAAGILTTLHNFDGTDGAEPSGGLIQVAGGTFYGTTFEGGAGPRGGVGTIFKITPAGTLTTLYNFCSQSRCTDGNSPVAGLIQGTDGSFYGTTLYGGSEGYGTVFKITSTGALSTLHSFDLTDGNEPYGRLVQGTDGTFYGTTYQGGAAGWGTVFSLGVGLRPLVETVPSSGRVGTEVTVLGSNLIGSFSVTFNGTPASFTVESPTAIKTSVPTGATSGPVQVVIPSGTLTSNANFQVLP